MRAAVIIGCALLVLMLVLAGRVTAQGVYQCETRALGSYPRIVLEGDRHGDQYTFTSTYTPPTATPTPTPTITATITPIPTTPNPLPILPTITNPNALDLLPEHGSAISESATGAGFPLLAVLIWLIGWFGLLWLVRR
jgi:hypothetical protein